MSSAKTLPQTIAESWLAMQCQIIPGVVRAGLFHSEDSDSDFPVAQVRWPLDSEDAAGLRVAAARALTQNQPVVCCEKSPITQSAGLRLNIACPILLDGNSHGVIAVEMENPDEQRQRAVLQMLQWGVLWLRVMLQQDSSSVASDTLQSIATALEPASFHAAATATVTQLASQFNCDRVSIGFGDSVALQLQALSNSANFDPRSNLARRLELCMREALQQETTVAYPAFADRPAQSTTAHLEQSQQDGNGGVLTIPLVNEGTLVGALSFERQTDNPFTAIDRERCEVLAAMLGPILELKRRKELTLARQLSGKFRQFAGSMLGTQHLSGKILALACVALIATLSLVHGDYRSTGDAALEGSIQRVVVAPMDGFIKSASTRPGDLVTSGQLMGALEDQELRLEQLRWSGQLAQLAKEHREALGNRDRSQVGILAAEMTQAEAQLQLLQEQLSRTEFRAPFDGVVVSGDLSQELGSPVERGSVLFTVAPLNSYRVVVQVPEQDILEVRVGQPGELVLAARPDQVLPITVDSITPVSNATLAGNFFRVEASLDASTDSLRPGMLGVAKIQIEQRRLIWIWTHRLTEWLKLWLWAWVA